MMKNVRKNIECDACNYEILSTVIVQSYSCRFCVLIQDGKLPDNSLYDKSLQANYGMVSFHGFLLKLVSYKDKKFKMLRPHLLECPLVQKK